MGVAKGEKYESNDGKVYAGRLATFVHTDGSTALCESESSSSSHGNVGPEHRVAILGSLDRMHNSVKVPVAAFLGGRRESTGYVQKKYLQILDQRQRTST